MMPGNTYIVIASIVAATVGVLIQRKMRGRKMADYLLLLLGMGLVTYLPRWLPLHYLSRRSLPEWFIQWLELIPAAILSALLLPALILGGTIPEAIDLAAAGAVGGHADVRFAWWKRSLGGTVVVGMLLFWLAGKVDPQWLPWVS
jgi:branched-subunit amino acid transport protein